MQKLRVFVSSPGDVGRERAVVERVMQQLNSEFAASLQIEPYFWEHEPMRATEDFQGQIPAPSSFDVVLCILWSRLGTRLGSRHTRPDGTRYASGTEFEFEDAAAAWRKNRRPEVYVYRNKSEVKVPVDSPEERRRRNEQLDQLEEFLDRWFKDPKDGTWKAALNTYDDLGKFESLIERHLRALILERLAQETPAVPGPAPVTWHQGSPFRGLLAFEFEHDAIFFGRTRAVGEVLDAWRQQAADGRAFVMVLGRSGVGKSSLVRAGVLPLLVRPGVIEGVGIWRRVVLRPSDARDDLAEALAHAILRHEKEGEGLPEMANHHLQSAKLAEAFRRDPVAACLLIQTGLSRVTELAATQNTWTKPPEVRLVVLIDQLEEIFTLERFDAAARQGFFRLLDALSRCGWVWVIATLRSDFQHRCEESTELMALKKGAGHYQLEPPDSTELGLMIRRPAAAAGLRFEEDKETGRRLEDLLRDAALRDPASLPLLGFTLEELYAQRRGRELTLAAYDALGGVEGAVAQRAEEVFTSLSSEGQAALDSVMRCLVAIGTDDPRTPTRKAALVDSPRSLIDTPGEREFVKAFIEARLLVPDRTRSGDAVVSLAHDALIGRWPRLKEWLAKDEGFLHWRTELERAAENWKTHPREVWMGARVDDARDWRKRRASDLTLDQHEFIRACERTRFVQRFTRITVVATILATAIGAALYFRNQSRLNHARELLAHASLQLARDPELSLLLCLEASTIDFSMAESSLREALLASRVRGRITNAGAAPYEGVEFRPGGTELLAARRDGVAEVWRWDEDHRTGVLWTNLPRHQAELGRAIFGPGSELALTVGFDDVTRLSHWPTAQPLMVFTNRQSGLADAAFSIDGRWFATAGKDGELRVIATNGQGRVSLRTGVPLNAVAFSPNQDRVAAGGEDGRVFLWPWPSRDDAQKPRALTPQKASPIHSLAFSPNGRWLLSTEAEGAAHMWDVVTGREQALPGHRRHAFDGTFGPQGEWMVTVGDEGVAKLWPTNHAREPAGELRGHSDAIASVAVRSDGRWIATAGRDGVVCLWDPPLGRRVAVVEAPALAGAFRDVGGQVLVVDGNFGAWAYDSRATGNARTLDGTPREGVGAISPDGRLALAQNPDGKVQIIDLATGQGAGAIVLPGEVSLAVFSSDSKWVVAAGTNDVPWLISVRDHTLGPRLPMVRGLSCATFAGGSRFLLTMGDEGVLRVWNVPLAASGAVEGPVAELRIEGEVAAIACPDDDETLVALAIGRRTEIRNWRSRQPLAVLEGHEEKVNAVRFGPAASRFLVTASGDRTARLWNWREERTLGVLAGHAGPVLWVAFDSKGEAVLTGTQGGEVRSYDLPELNRDQQQVVALARSRLTRGFSDAERRSYHLAKPR